MKRVIVAVTLVAGIAAVSFATLSSAENSRKKMQPEKKTNKELKEKQCSKTCLYS